MSPNRVAARRALMLVSRLKVVAINAIPTAFAQKRRAGIQEAPDKARISAPLVQGPGSCRLAASLGAYRSRKYRKSRNASSIAVTRVFELAAILILAISSAAPIKQARSGLPGIHGGPSPAAYFA